MKTEDVSGKERLHPIACIFFYIILFVIYIATGIISFNLISPNGFLNVIGWLIVWNIVAGFIDFIFAMIVSFVTDKNI